MKSTLTINNRIIFPFVVLLSVFLGSCEQVSNLSKDEEGIVLDAMRATAFPFHESVEQFIEAHDQVFVIEQNRDAQMKSIITIELQIDPSKLISVLNYDGMPITADHIMVEITKNLSLSPQTN